MSFSQYAGTAIVPTLSRLVLCAAFVTAGWNKVFTESDFTAEQVAELQKLKINVPYKLPKQRATDFSPTSSIESSSMAIRLASYQQEQPPVDEPEVETLEPQETTTEVIEVIEEEPQAIEESAPPQAVKPQGTVVQPDGGSYRARSLHHLTLLIHSKGWPMPVWQARLAAFTELVGGALLLVGLLSRVWGLGLAITMGVAFYMTSLGAIQQHGFFNLPPMDSATLFVQLSLFVLAFGVLLTGPGPLSLDRLFVSKTPKPVDMPSASNEGYPRIPPPED